MEIFTLNSNYEREALLEGYTSAIYTIRYNDLGDFQIEAPVGSSCEKLLSLGTIIHLPESDRPMVVRQRVKTVDDDKTIVRISGYDLASILLDRYPIRGWKDNTTPGAIATSLVKSVCVDGAGPGGSYDVIPNFTVQDWSDTFTPVEASGSGRSLYEIVKDLMVAEDRGFGVFLSPSEPRLIFRCYSYQERPELLLSSVNDSLTSESYLYSDTDFKNIAYVYGVSSSMPRIYSANGYPTTVSGLNRRAMYIDATDIKLDDYPSTAEYDAALDQKGKEALAEHNLKIMFDGALLPESNLRYGLDFLLGDSLTFYGDYGSRVRVRVTENIWSIDSTGVNIYPTLVSH